MSLWIIQVLNALSYAMLLFMLAAGLTLTFGILRIVNLAHGSLYLVGGYLGLMVVQNEGSFWLGMLVGAVAMALVGISIQRFLLARYPNDELAQVLLTIGCLFLLGDLALWQFGGTPQLISAPKGFDGPVSIAGALFPAYRLVLIGIGLLVALLLWWFVEKTRMGMLVRAAINDPETAMGLGVNVPRMMTGIFTLGAFLAGGAGVIGGPLIGMYPSGEMDILLLSLVVVILGGMGSLRGAFLASIIVGGLDTAGRSIPALHEFTMFAIFVPMALVLIFKPKGLMGTS
jgi:branched-chain amino acid transport system permease protein